MKPMLFFPRPKSSHRRGRWTDQACGCRGLVRPLVTFRRLGLQQSPLVSGWVCRVNQVGGQVFPLGIRFTVRVFWCRIVLITGIGVVVFAANRYQLGMTLKRASPMTWMAPLSLIFWLKPNRSKFLGLCLGLFPQFPFFLFLGGGGWD